MTNANAAAKSTTNTAADSVTAILFEHEDGRYAINPNTTGDPAWHRLGPVDVSALAAPAQAVPAQAVPAPGVPRDAVRSVYSRSMDLVRTFWQQHTKSDALSMTMSELHDDVELALRAARGAAQAAPVDAAVLRDAERWMKLEAEAVRDYVEFNNIWYGSAEDLRHGVDQLPATYAARAARERNK